MLLNRGPNGFGNSLTPEGDPEEMLVNDAWTASDGMTIDENGNAECDPLQEVGSLEQELAPEFQNLTAPIRIEIVVTSITQGSLLVDGPDAEITTAGTHIVYADETRQVFSITSGGFCDAVIDMISMKLLTDAQLGPELTTNGTFDSAIGWVLTDPVQLTIAGGALTSASPSGECYAINTDCVLDPLSLYKVVIEKTDNGITSGIYSVVTNDAPDSYPDEMTSVDPGAGTFSYFCLPFTGGSVALYFADDAEVSVLSISVKKYT